MTELAEVLDGAEPGKQAEATPEAEAPEVEATTETEEAPKGETSEPPSEDTDLTAQLAKAQAEIEAFKAKAIDETGKRQQIEQQLAQQRQQPQEKVDFWENPDEALNAITSTVDQKLQAIDTAVSVKVMRALHDDYGDMEAKFVEDAQANPALVFQMQQSGDPAKFAYDYGKMQTRMAEAQDPDKLREQIRAEERAKLEAESKEKIEAEIAKASQLPGSLSTERGSAATSNHASPDLEKLIGQ